MLGKRVETMDIEPIMQLTFALEVISAVMLLGLLYIYLNSRKVIKNVFTLGLVVFAAFLFLNSVGMLYTHACTVGVYKVDPNYVFITAVLKVIGLGALLYITWRGI